MTVTNDDVDQAVDIKALLDSISDGAIFFIGTDADEFLYTQAAGRGFPYYAAWCKKGFRKIGFHADEEHQPLLREDFIEAVLERDDYSTCSIPDDFYNFD